MTIPLSQQRGWAELVVKHPMTSRPVAGALDPSPFYLSGWKTVPLAISTPRFTGALTTGRPRTARESDAVYDGGQQNHDHSDNSS